MPDVGERVDPGEQALAVGVLDVKPTTVTCDATTWIAFSSPVASIVAAGPTRVSGFLMMTSSAYVPGHTTTVTPAGAAATAALIDVKVALRHDHPAPDDEASGDT